MLLVHTSQVKERQRLEEEFRKEEGVIAVPVKQAQVLGRMMESITFQYFHGRSSGLARMVQEYVMESLSLKHSMDRYRELMREIKQYEERERVYRDYLQAMSQQINEQAIVCQAEQEGCNVQEMELPQQPFEDENRTASLLEMIDLPLLRLDSNKNTEEESQSEMTKNSTSTSGTNKETLGGLAKLGNFFYSASAVYSREEWKTQRQPKKQESKQLNSFRKMGEGVIQANSSLCTLLACQMAYDIKREILDTHPQKQARLMEQRYSRRIKDTLLYSKIGLRRRK